MEHDKNMLLKYNFFIIHGRILKFIVFYRYRPLPHFEGRLVGICRLGKRALPTLRIRACDFQSLLVFSTGLGCQFGGLACLSLSFSSSSSRSSIWRRNLHFWRAVQTEQSLWRYSWRKRRNWRKRSSMASYSPHMAFFLCDP